MSRISNTFARCAAENRKALIVYVTVGCPTPAESEELIGKLIESGADMIELGVPFSDPMADGPVIQEAGQKALAAGTKLQDILDIAGRIRMRFPATPLILFSYYNVILNYGLDPLGAALRKNGIDGLLTVDLPLEEREEIMPMCGKYGIDFIPLISPATSPERMAKIAAGCKGFIYAITVRGITGVRDSLPPELAGELENARKACGLPVAAGFGISTPEMARGVAKHADAVIVGSAMVKAQMEGGNEKAAGLIRGIAAALK